MMSRRRMTPRVVAAVGAALVAVAMSAGGAGADTALASFGASGLGRGVNVKLGPQGIVIDPLVNVGAMYTRTQMNSIPQSESLSGVIFPGDLAQSVAGEGGTADNKGLPAAWIFTLEARLGAEEEREVSYSVSGTKLIGVTAESARMYTLAKLHRNVSEAQGQRVIVQPDPSAPPILTMDTVASKNTAALVNGSIVQEVVVRASGIELLDGAIRISSVTSRARAISNGSTVTAIEAATEIGDVRVIGSEGVAHRAYIDSTGIHVDDPALKENVNQSLSIQLGTAMRKIGLSVVTAETATTIDGAAGTAAAGGLVIAFEGACEACPSVIRMTPAEVRRAYSNLPDIPPAVGCILSSGPESPFNDLPVDPLRDPEYGTRPVPFCLQLAIIPIPPALAGSITIGGALSQVSASLPVPFGPFDPNLPPCCSGPGFVPGGPIDSGSGGSVVPPGGGGIPQQPFQPNTTPVFGLFAEMPDGALAGFGAALLFLAVAMGIGPSLRREDRA